MPTKRKDPKRVAAAKKAARTRKRNAAKKPRRRRSARPRKKGMMEGMADNFSLNRPSSPANQAIQGAVGGGLLHLITQGRTAQEKRTYMLTALVAAIAMDKPGIAAGVAGVIVMDHLSQNQGSQVMPMNEGHQYFDPSTLSEPLVLDPSGQPVLMSDGSGGMPDNQYYLSQGLYDGGLYDGSPYSDYFPATY